MRYPPHQKAETHKQIVEVASREFRAHGLEGIGIADVMGRAGLTAGGFYAHFKDRDALVAEATERAAEQSLRRLAEAAASRPGREVEAMLDFYLSPEHRDDPGRGCLLPALGSEMSRQSSVVREAFTRSLAVNLNKVASFMPGTDVKTRRAQAMAFMSGMAGAVLLARAVEDAKLSNVLLGAVRSQLLSQYGPGRA